MLEPIKQGMGFVIRHIYDFTGMYVLAIAMLTIIVKTALLPLVLKQLRSQEAMAKLQPKLKEIQKKYRNDKETQNIKTMELYKEHNANPFASCLPLLIQIPIIWALFGVFKNPQKYIFSDLADQGLSIVENKFLWVKNLAQPDMISNIFSFDGAGSIPGIFPIAAAALTYLQFVVASPTADLQAQGGQGEAMTRNMKILMPLMILMFSRQMSAALVIYWVVSNIYQICQQILIRKSKDKKKEAV